jgi:hypothetical protein
VVYTSTTALIFLREGLYLIHKVQASKRQNTSSQKYNDNITLLI